jgi:hypothetical protein
VYLPCGGWRGYDPGHGGAVASAHVAVAAACNGAGASSSLEYTLDIRTRN